MLIRNYKQDLLRPGAIVKLINNPYLISNEYTIIFETTVGEKCMIRNNEHTNTLIQVKYTEISLVKSKKLSL